nr:uncharacterized protein LOC127483828 [Oryctolagus cuniculus]
MSVPSRKSARSTTLPGDAVRRVQGRRAKAMVRRRPPSNRYSRRRRRRLRPVNFPRGRWEFWETRRSASRRRRPSPRRRSGARLWSPGVGLRSPQLTGRSCCVPRRAGGGPHTCSARSGFPGPRGRGGSGQTEHGRPSHGHASRCALLGSLHGRRRRWRWRRPLVACLASLLSEGVPPGVSWAGGFKLLRARRENRVEGLRPTE